MKSVYVQQGSDQNGPIAHQELGHYFKIILTIYLKKGSDFKFKIQTLVFLTYHSLRG